MVVIVVAVIIHSLDMALKIKDFYIVIVSLVVCAIIGEWMRHKNSAQNNYYIATLIILSV